MARELTAAAAAAADGQVVRPVLFFEGEYASGTLRLWSGVGTYSWNGQDWTGAGNLLGFGAIGETAELRAVGFEVSLSGEVASILSINLGQARQGLPGRAWLGFFDDDGDLIADPFKCFEGRFDVPDIVDDGARARLSARYESRLIDLDRARERKYTDQDQRIDYPNDGGMRHVAGLQDKPIFWGKLTLEQHRQRKAETRRRALEAMARFNNPSPP